MYQFVSPINIYHGSNSLNKLYDVINKLNINKVAIIADPILQEIKLTDKIITQINSSGVSIDLITSVEPEPSITTGNKTIKKIKNFEPDLVIGIGGGSALDLAKTAAVLVKNSGDIEDYLNLTGTKEILNKGVPKILIPTTAGTGAEVTDIAVFSLSDTKDAITHEYLLADYAIVDPDLTYTLPARITASSGIDALTHAIESYTSKFATPITRMLSREAIQLIIKNIRTAVWNGENKIARDNMALGSLLAGLSFYNAGVAGVHALAYPLGGIFKISHGESNAVLLPYVYDQIWNSCINDMIDIAVLFNLPTNFKNDREIAIDVINYLKNLMKDVDLPTDLKEYGVHEKDIPALTKGGILQTRLLNRSPKTLNEALIKRIYKNAYKGILESEV